MSTAITFVLFGIGVFLVVKGGDIFVDAASWIAKASGVPTFIIGATIVSVATTLPEMIVSMMAAGQGKIDMAIGNAVGSVTANTGLILSIAMLFMTIICPRRDFMAQCLLLVAAAGLLLAGSSTGVLETWGSVALLMVFALFVYVNIRTARRDVSEEKDRPAITGKDLGKNLLKFALGAACIVAGSQLLVNSGSDIAKLFGVPERIIAVTLVAIGTSLPELVTTLTAIAKKQSGLSIGNLIGANIIDLTLILPLCGLASGAKLPVVGQSLTVDIPVCLGIVLLAVIPMIFRQKGAKWQGVAMLAGYAGYLTMVL